MFIAAKITPPGQETHRGGGIACLKFTKRYTSYFSPRVRVCHETEVDVLVGTSLRCALIGCLCVGCSLQATKPPEPTLPAAFDGASAHAAVHWPSEDWYHG